MSEEGENKEENSTDSPNQTVKEPVQVVEKSGSSHVSLIVMLVCIVAAAVGLIFYFKNDGNGGNKANGKGPNGQTIAGNLVDGKEYLIYLRSVEVQPKKATGKPWDPRNSAPDVFYRVVWKTNQIYESETMDDSLIAEWVPVGLSLKDSILSGQVSVDQAIKIPRVKVDVKLKESDEVVFKVIDNDLLSGNDSVQDLRVYLSKLSVGDNVFDFSDKSGHGLIKAVVRVIDNSLSTDEKIQALMRGQ